MQIACSCSRRWPILAPLQTRMRCPGGHQSTGCTPGSETMKRMIIDCVQCGNEFELSPVEVDHYVSKGFDLPKRCSDCRKKKS